MVARYSLFDQQCRYRQTQKARIVSDAGFLF
jgi:hypothetical protein